MRLWILLLIALLANFALAGVAKRQAEDPEQGAIEFEEPPAEQDNEAPVDTPEEEEENEEPAEETEQQVEDADEGEEQQTEDAGQEGPVQEETAADDEEAQPKGNDEDAETPEAAVDDEEPEQPADEEENQETADENEEPAEENVESEIREETEEPANIVDETEQPEGTEPTDENTETSDTTGQTDFLPTNIATDLPKAEKPEEAAAEEPYVDALGWTHYPWKKFPITKHRFSIKKECGCQVAWIKKVYTRKQPKPTIYLAHSKYVSFKRPCRRHRHHHLGHGDCGCNRHHHHHHRQRKPIRTVQHVTVHHVPKPCTKKPIVKHITKYTHVRPGRHLHHHHHAHHYDHYPGGHF